MATVANSIPVPDRVRKVRWRRAPFILPPPRKPSLGGLGSETENRSLGAIGCRLDDLLFGMGATGAGCHEPGARCTAPDHIDRRSCRPGAAVVAGPAHRPRGKCRRP